MLHAFSRGPLGALGNCIPSPWGAQGTFLWGNREPEITGVFREMLLLQDSLGAGEREEEAWEVARGLYLVTRALLYLSPKSISSHK